MTPILINPVQSKSVCDRCALIISCFLVSAGLFLGGSSAGEAIRAPGREDLANCVDSCIVELTRLNGTPVSREQLERAIKRLGLNPSASSRSLLQCKEILEALGFSVLVDRVSRDPGLTYSCICFLPSRDVGHVVVISPDGDDWYRIFDPDDAESVRSLAGAHLGIVETVGIGIKPNKRSWIAVLGLSMLAIALKILLGSITWRPSLMLLPLIMLTGCESTPSEEIYDRVLQHDFGVIRDADGINRISHSFDLRNDTDTEIQLSTVSVSCTCVAADSGDAPFILPPGTTRELPVYISIVSKNGPFREEIYVRFGGKQPDKVLRLTGFIDRPATPVTNPVVLQLRESTLEQVANVSIKKFRSKEIGEIDEIDSLRIVGAQSHAFAIGDPSKSTVPAGIDSVSDLWSVPVSYSGGVPSTADLHVTWKRSTQTTSVSIRVVKPPIVEVPAGVIHLPLTAVGEVVHESIPIIVLDVKRATEIRVESSDESYSGMLDISKRNLSIKFTPESPGVVPGELYLKIGDEVLATLRIKCKVPVSDASAANESDSVQQQTKSDGVK